MSLFHPSPLLPVYHPAFSFTTWATVALPGAFLTCSALGFDGVRAGGGKRSGFVQWPREAPRPSCLHFASLLHIASFLEFCVHPGLLLLFLAPIMFHLVISMSHSWHFRERACQFHSENYHSVADHVCLGQTYAYIRWPEDLDSQFVPPLPAFPQGKTLPRTLCRWQMSRLLSSPPGITHERDTRAQLVNI